MFTKLDDILFPNKVEVIDYDGKYIYPIFKNASSSLTEHATVNNYKIILNEQIRKLDTIEVFIRDPKARYVSGVATYLFNNKLDINVIQPGIFLDRHYLPQLHWLINLMRYMDLDSKLHIHSLEMIKEFTPLAVAPEKCLLTDTSIADHQDLEMYMRLDNLIFNQLTGQSWTPNQIMTHLLAQDPMAYFTVIGKTQKLAEVTHVLPSS